MFLKAGIEYKGRNQFNETILFVSACGNNSTLTEILIEGGCDLNECTRSWTALHVAAARNHDDVLRVLVKHGCDLNIRDRDGMFDMSRLFEHTETCSFDNRSMFSRFQCIDVSRIE
jgi:ankyrin repeat protein